MRNIMFIFKFIIASVLAFLLQLFFHEMGHAVFALITGNRVVGVSFGLVSYAEIQLLNQWSLWIISIGAFILPVVICCFFEIFHNQFIKLLSCIILSITTIQLAINAVAVLCVQEHSQLQTYDLGLCVTDGNMNNIFVGIVALICVLLLSVWGLRKLKEIVDNI